MRLALLAFLTAGAGDLKMAKGTNPKLADIITILLVCAPTCDLNIVWPSLKLTDIVQLFLSEPDHTSPFIPSYKPPYSTLCCDTNQKRKKKGFQSCHKRKSTKPHRIPSRFFSNTKICSGNFWNNVFMCLRPYLRTFVYGY